MNFITKLNSILEQLDITQTGKFEADATTEFKFKVNQKYLEEQGFLVVQNDLLKLNKKIQEDLHLSEHVLNYRVEIDPTRNIVQFKPSTEFKYAPEIVNIRNIPKAFSPNKDIFEDYPLNTLIPVLVGPPPIDYLRRRDGEKTNMFSGIGNNAFEALEKATKQEDQYKTDFHLAHVLNIAMLPNGKWVIINDNDVIDKLGFPTAKFKELLSPDFVMNSLDIWNSRGNPAQPFYDTPFMSPVIRALLTKLKIEVREHQTTHGRQPRFTTTEDRTALVPKLGPFRDAASLHHLLHYYILYPLLKQDGQVDETMPPANKGFLCERNGASIGPTPPTPNS
jgi:hypothetical protein